MIIGKESLFFATLHISNQILCKKTGSPRGYPHRAGRPGHHRLRSPGGSWCSPWCWCCWINNVDDVESTMLMMLVAWSPSSPPSSTTSPGSTLRPLSVTSQLFPSIGCRWYYFHNNKIVISNTFPQALEVARERRPDLGGKTRAGKEREAAKAREEAAVREVGFDAGFDHGCKWLTMTRSSGDSWVDGQTWGISKARGSRCPLGSGCANHLNHHWIFIMSWVNI